VVNKKDGSSVLVIALFRKDNFTSIVEDYFQRIILNRILEVVLLKGLHIMKM
jgi:hypothetical protein